MAVPIANIMEPADWQDREMERLEAENAKLRELVRTFYHCTTSGECDECPINGGGPVRLMPDTICDTIHDRMREFIRKGMDVAVIDVEGKKPAQIVVACKKYIEAHPEQYRGVKAGVRGGRAYVWREDPR